MKRYLLLITAAIVVAAGCSPESSRPEAKGEGRVRAINTIATAPDFGFFVEERFLDSANFKIATRATTWDGLQYTFNFDVLLTGDTTRTRAASVSIDVQDGRDYTMVLSGAVEAPDVTVWEEDIREWSEGDTTFEVRFGNLSPALGPVDIYFELPGTVPAAGNALGTVDFGEVLPALEFAPEERVLYLTAVGDPSTILFESVGITLAARTSYLFGPFDADANDLGPISVVLMNATLGGGGVLADINTEATARFFHASLNMGNADVYIDDPLTAPLVANHAFEDVTGDLPVPSGDVPLTYTAPGNTGSILIDSDRTFNVGTRQSVFALRNADGEDVAANFVIDRRSVETQAKMTIVNTSADNPIVDVYVVPTGESIEETGPLIPFLAAFTQPFTAPLLPNQYDIYLTVPTEKTILAGPIALDAQAGDVVEGVIYDTVDPNVAKLVFIPLP